MLTYIPPVSGVPGH